MGVWRSIVEASPRAISSSDIGLLFWSVSASYIQTQIRLKSYPSSYVMLMINCAGNAKRSEMQVNVPESILQEVKLKLRFARLDESMGSVEWNDLEVGHAKFKQLVEFWRDEYDWRKFGAFLNTFHHFKASVQVSGFGALNIHFLHHQSSRADAVPLLFVHGWYGGS